MKFSRVIIFIVLILALIFVVRTLMIQLEDEENSNVQEIQSSANINNELDGHNVSEIVNETENTNENKNQTNDDPDKNNDIDAEPTDSPAIKPDTNAESVSVIVNPNYKLPENYEPTDLVYPDVRFIFEDKIEKRMLRQEAATALEVMFDAAGADGIYLAGVSGYRSHSTQTALFNRYVERDGFEKAITYSAEPGTSEHETGLAIDVTSSDGKCAAQDCFGGTVEAIWLENNAAQYGFIIRYPKGKEEITGYKYEPWHLRYVGIEVATDIAAEQLTLEEYYDVEPVKR